MRSSTTLLPALWFLALWFLALVPAAHAQVTEDLPCDDDTIGDVWTFSVSDPSEVMILVDTTAAATAFDPAMDVIPASGPPWEVVSSAVLGGGDDELNCTYPPPQFGCPAWGGEVNPGTVAVLIFNMKTCAGTIGEYSLRVIACGQDITPTLAGDDQSVTFTTDGAATPVIVDGVCPGAPDPDPDPQPEPAADAGPVANDPAPVADAGPDDDVGNRNNQPPPPSDNGDAGDGITGGCRSVDADLPLALGTWASFALLAAAYRRRRR
jgi:hypothetical protein